jgi:hypothetical protein
MHTPPTLIVHMLNEHTLNDFFVETKGATLRDLNLEIDNKE